MNECSLLLVISLVGAFCLWIEKKLSWLSHISGICLTILIAMILSALNVVPHEHDLYNFFMGPMVLIAIALMTFGLRLDNFLTLPRPLLLSFGIGILASIIGGIIVAVLGSKTIGIDSAKIAAQLAASYIGGNENAVAVARMLEVPNGLFIATFSMDSIVTSLWMIVSIATIPSMGTLKESDSEQEYTLEGSSTLLSLLFCIAMALLTFQASELLHHHIGLLHQILYITLVALCLGQVKAFHKLLRPSYLIGSLIFVPFFFSTGAVSNPKLLGSLPISLAIFPALIVAIHGIIIYSAGYFLKIPISYTSIASQSLIGGAGTAVAAARARNWQQGIFFGLVLGLVGYAIANFCGLFVYSVSVKLIQFIGVQ